MNEVKDRVCPKCSGTKNRAHCNNVKCIWRICTTCSPNMFTSTVFVNTKYFLQKRNS